MGNANSKRSRTIANYPVRPSPAEYSGITIAAAASTASLGPVSSSLSIAAVAKFEDKLLLDPKAS